MARRSVAAGFILFVLFMALPVPAGEITQHFPAHEPFALRRTAWRVTWGYTDPGTVNQSNTLYIAGASFMRGFKPDGGEDWVDIIKDARLSEIYAPYNNYASIYDISGLRGQLVPGQVAHMWPSCVTESVLLDTYAMKEVHDNGVRWMDRTNTARRGQVMVIWATLDAGNYRFPMEYGFRDDGVVTFRLGATGQNLYPFQSNGGDIHLHTACWRVEMALGDPTKNQVFVSRRTKNAAGKHIQVLDPVTSETELSWVPEEFTSLRIRNSETTNRRVPPNNISYDLISMRTGKVSTTVPSEMMFNNDFFVTAAQPAQPEAAGEMVQLAYLKLGSLYLQNRESLVNKSPAVWFHAPLLHVPRDEDFAPNTYSQVGSVALTAWTEFHLKPRNLFSSTPLHPNTPPQSSTSNQFQLDDY